MKFGESIKKILGNGLDSFRRYPAALTCALIFTLANIFRIVTENGNTGNWLVYSSLDHALIFGMVFSIAGTAFVRTRNKGEGVFRLINILGIILTAAAFFLLYYTGSKQDSSNIYYSDVLSFLTRTRMVFLTLICGIGYIYSVSGDKKERDISGTLFMLIKAFLLAFLFGLVFYLGTSGIYTAVRVLLINDLTFKIPRILAYLAFLLGFSILTGYLPLYDDKSIEDVRTNRNGYPAFFTVLLDYILIPVFFILSVVLLLWVIRNITGGAVQIEGLYGITTSYVTGGLLLLIMVYTNTSMISRVYKKVFPFISILFLLYEGLTMVREMNFTGLRSSEYAFILIITGAIIASVFFILNEKKAHWVILIVSALLLALSVAPFINFRDLPVRMQTARLEKLLNDAGMLRDGKIVKGSGSLDKDIKMKITSSSDYLSRQENTVLPSWFPKDSIINQGFESVMGFDKTYASETDKRSNYNYIRLINENEAIDISGFTHLVSGTVLQEDNGTVELKGRKADYNLTFRNFSPKYSADSEKPQIVVKNPDGTEETVDLSSYFENLKSVHFGKTPDGKEVVTKELNYETETKNLTFMIKFRSIEMNSEEGAKDKVVIIPDVSEILIREN